MAWTQSDTKSLEKLVVDRILSKHESWTFQSEDGGKLLIDCDGVKFYFIFIKGTFLFH